MDTLDLEALCFRIHVIGDQMLIGVDDSGTHTGGCASTLMVRYRLMLVTGQLVDGARTHPQTHHYGARDGVRWNAAV